MKASTILSLLFASGFSLFAEASQLEADDFNKLPTEVQLALSSIGIGRREWPLTLEERLEALSIAGVQPQLYTHENKEDKKVTSTPVTSLHPKPEVKEVKTEIGYNPEHTFNSLEQYLESPLSKESDAIQVEVFRKSPIAPPFILSDFAENWDEMDESLKADIIRNGLRERRQQQKLLQGDAKNESKTPVVSETSIIDTKHVASPQDKLAKYQEFLASFGSENFVSIDEQVAKLNDAEEAPEFLPEFAEIWDLLDKTDRARQLRSALRGIRDQLKPPRPQQRVVQGQVPTTDADFEEQVSSFAAEDFKRTQEMHETPLDSSIVKSLPKGPKADLLKNKDYTIPEECVICGEEHKESEVLKGLPCGHFFHDQCISPWILKKNNCPICRAEFN